MVCQNAAHKGEVFPDVMSYHRLPFIGLGLESNATGAVCPALSAHGTRRRLFNLADLLHGSAQSCGFIA
jgi:hypothetical protein